MNNKEIIENVKQGVDELLVGDWELLERNLSERCITHRMAMYLDALFPDHNVDCEYNGNVDEVGDRKRVDLLFNELREKGLLTPRQLTAAEKEVVDKLVYPDIIIHKRGNNESNLCIIEIKKSTSAVSREYDYLKLKAYTDRSPARALRYQLGIFVELGCGESAGKIEYHYFEDGDLCA